MQEIAIGVSLPVQSNSAVAEFDVFSAEIGQARFRMEGRGGARFHKHPQAAGHRGDATHFRVFRFIGGTPEQLADVLKVEIRRWAEVAKSASLVGK